MKHNYSIAERNRIVEENLPIIDKVIRRNWPLMRAAHLEYDDVYQDLAVRLIRCVDHFDPDKSSLKELQGSTAADGHCGGPSRISEA